MPLTFCAAATSRRNRFRNSGSSASSARITLTATGRPPGDKPRNTWPIPPLPSTPVSSYGPIRDGSPGRSPLTMAQPSPALSAHVGLESGHAYHTDPEGSGTRKAEGPVQEVGGVDARVLVAGGFGWLNRDRLSGG